MAYGKIYELIGKSTINQFVRKIEIWKDGYSGPVIYRNMPGKDAFRMRKDSEGTIQGTSFEFGIRTVNDFELIDLYTSDYKKYRIYLLFNTTNKWHGWLLPQQYLEPYIPAPNNIYFTAADGLGLLKNYPFELTGWQTQMQIIKYCIDNTGPGSSNNLKYAIAVNIRPSGQATNRAPFEQVKEKADIYAGMNCYEVLEQILQKYHAIITQNNYMWLIRRYKDINSTRYIYTSAGSYETTQNAPAILDIGRKGASGIDIWPVGNLMLEIEQAYKGVVIEHDYGLKESLLPNWNFEIFSESTGFANWTKVGTFTLEQKYDITNKFYFAALLGKGTSWTKYIYQSISVEADASSMFRFAFEAALSGAKVVGSEYESTLLNMRLWVYLEAGGQTRHSLTFAQGWVAQDVHMTFAVQSTLPGAALNWVRKTLITNPLPFSGTITIRLFADGQNAPSEFEIWYVAWKNIEIAFMISENENWPEKNSADHAFSNQAIEQLSDVSVMCADAPALSNVKLAYNNFTVLTENENPTSKWKNDDSATERSFIEHLAQCLEDRYRLPLQILTGIIRANNLSFDTIIRHIYNNYRLFEIPEADFDLIEERMNVRLRQLVPYTMSAEAGAPAEVETESLPVLISPRLRAERNGEAFTQYGASWEGERVFFWVRVDPQQLGWSLSVDESPFWLACSDSGTGDAEKSIFILENDTGTTRQAIVRITETTSYGVPDWTILVIQEANPI